MLSKNVCLSEKLPLILFKAKNIYRRRVLISVNKSIFYL